jgi:hypothetical protein
VNSIYSYRTKYNNNYWGESRIIPKIFLGMGRLYLFSYQRTPREWEDVYLPFPTIHVDWNPAQEPYDINVTQNYDNNDYFRTIDRPFLGRFPLIHRLLDILRDRI